MPYEAVTNADNPNEGRLKWNAAVADLDLRATGLEDGSRRKVLILASTPDPELVNEYIDSATGAHRYWDGSGWVDVAVGAHDHDDLYYTETESDARFEQLTRKGQANGYAPLGADGKVPDSFLSALALTDVYVVASQAAQLALSAQEGDIAVRTDQNRSYAHNGGNAGTMADWTELRTPTDAVLSVDGRTGAVSLTDLYAALSHKARHEPGGADAMTVDAAAATGSLRTLGTGAQQAAAGNDSRLSDQRTPTDTSVTPAKMSAENKAIVICTSTTRPASPVEGQHIYETDTDLTMKNTGTPGAPVWTNAGSSAATATESAQGVVELATEAEVQAGTAGTLVATVARLKAELDRRKVVQYFFDAERTGSVMNLGAAGASTKIIFNTENTDNGSWYDPTTGLATIPVTGLYRLYASVKWAAPATGETGQIQYSINGGAPVTMNLTRFTAATEITSDFELELPFTAGQTVEIRGQTSLGAIDAQFAPSTRFQMRYIGPLV